MLDGGTAAAAGQQPRDALTPGETESAKRRQIMEGARRIFVTVGFDAASMNDITREAGVSKSTLYVYFRSKEELFEALISEEQERYFASIDAVLQDPGRPEEALHAFGMQLGTLTTSTALVLAKRTVIAVASRMPELGRDFYRNGPERGLKRLAAFLSASCEAGALTIEDVDLAAAQFVELAAAGILRRRLFDETVPPPTREELEYTVSSAVRLFIKGYGTRTA